MRVSTLCTLLLLSGGDLAAQGLFTKPLKPILVENLKPASK
jgi:hypothetical protein